MLNHKFIICNGDTDSIMFCKNNMLPFTVEEQESLLEEINSLLPTQIRFANDGVFKKVICLKAKNYIMVDEKGKRKIKGSALKSATLEPRMKDMLNDMINALVEDKQDELVSIYHKYIREASNITDMKPWCSKKTLSATTYASTRKNETNIIDAIKDTEYVEGDKIYCYFKSDGSLQLAERFDGDYHKPKYFEKVYNTALRFSTVIDDSIFLNFKLKRNLKQLEELLNETL